LKQTNVSVVHIASVIRAFKTLIKYGAGRKDTVSLPPKHHEVVYAI
jgi:hypothetical protein